MCKDGKWLHSQSQGRLAQMHLRNIFCESDKNTIDTLHICQHNKFQFHINTQEMLFIVQNM